MLSVKQLETDAGESWKRKKDNKTFKNQTVQQINVNNISDSIKLHSEAPTSK